MSPRPDRPRRCAVLLAALLAAASARAAPLADIAFASGGRVQHLSLRVENRILRARLPGSTRDLWHVVLQGDAPAIVAGPPVPEACPPRTWATLEVYDRDGDGLVEPSEGDHARIHLVASHLPPSPLPSVIATVEIDATLAARLSWSLSGAALPGLGQLVAPVALLRTSGSRTVLLTTGGLPSGDGARGGEVLAFDAATGQLLARPFGVEVPMAGGIASLDTDADGTDDRLYVPDLSGRVWRLDRIGASVRELRFRPVQLADLGALIAPGTALLVAPDVALAGADAGRWLQVTVGTSSLDARAAEHRLFRLRDPRLAPWNAADLAVWRPIAPHASTPDPRATWETLPGPLFTRPLTVAGHQIVVTGDDGPGECSVTQRPVTVTVLPPAGGGTPAGPAAPRVVDALLAEDGASLRLEWPAAAHGEPASAPRCLLGDAPLPVCPAGPEWTQDFWLREDAP